MTKFSGRALTCRGKDCGVPSGLPKWSNPIRHFRAGLQILPSLRDWIGERGHPSSPGAFPQPVKPVPTRDDSPGFHAGPVSGHGGALSCQRTAKLKRTRTGRTPAHRAIELLSPAAPSPGEKRMHFVREKRDNPPTISRSPPALSRSPLTGRKKLKKVRQKRQKRDKRDKRHNPPVFSQSTAYEGRKRCSRERGKRFNPSCGLTKIARRGFAGEKTTKGHLASLAAARPLAAAMPVQTNC